VPMLLMGDEVGRSQGGNNNSWCQDSPLSWMVWNDDHCDLELKLFLQRLLRLRQALPQLFNPLVPPPETSRKQPQTPTDLWRQWHGVELSKPDWAAWSRTTATSLHMGSRGALLWMGFNAYNEPLNFELPVPASPWMQVIDTSLPAGEDLPSQAVPFDGVDIPLASRSLVLLLAREVASGLKL
jgi:isoamylase